MLMWDYSSASSTNNSYGLVWMRFFYIQVYCWTQSCNSFSSLKGSEQNRSFWV